MDSVVESSRYQKVSLTFWLSSQKDAFYEIENALQGIAYGHGGAHGTGCDIQLFRLPVEEAAVVPASSGGRNAVLK